MRYRVQSRTAARDFRSYLLRSPDGGRTWEGLRPVDAGFSGQSYPSSLVTLPDGSVLMGLYGTDRPDLYKQWYVRLARSTDHGLTWTPWGSGIRTEREFTEPQLLVEPNRLLMTIRSDSAEPGAFIAESVDQGTTWSVPRRITTATSGMPTLAKLADGRYVMAYRDNGPFRYMVSSDLVSWTMGLDVTGGSNAECSTAGLPPVRKDIPGWFMPWKIRRVTLLPGLLFMPQQSPQLSGYVGTYASRVWTAQ